jgi:hypothetical protein
MLLLKIGSFLKPQKWHFPPQNVDENKARRQNRAFLDSKR